MNCREVSNLLPLFLDGELEPRQMRSVAMHSMRCPACELEVKEMERLQELVGSAVRQRVAEMDLSGVWSAVEQRIGDIRPSWVRRLRARWEELQADLDMRLPAFAAVAAVAALALAWYAQLPDVTQPIESRQIASHDPALEIQRLDTTSPSFSFFRDPESDTSVVWLNYEEGLALESQP
jgi:anti-sigma factor RsiW